jgi:hypothetical protein
MAEQHEEQRPATEEPKATPATEKKEGKEQAAGEAGQQAVAEAAAIEGQAVAEAAAALKEAERIAEAAGERAAQKWLDAKLTEIENAANKRIEELKTWLEGRLTEIHAKKSGEGQTGESAPAAESPRETVQREEPKSRRYRFI